MAYNKFSIDKVIKEFDIQIIGDQELFRSVQPVAPSALLREFLDKYMLLGSAIGTEKARSEFIIAPILAELTELTHHQVSLFSGVSFDVDDAKGLVGWCDFIISVSSLQYSIVAPVLAVVEAKNENLHLGLGQCMAEMIAAQLFNARASQPLHTIYGAVTTGSVWRFLKLEEQRVYIDKREYFIEALAQLLGILMEIVSAKSA